MFDFRPIDLSDEGIEETCKLLRVVFPDAHNLTPAYLKSLYFGNPLGETWGLCCFDDRPTRAQTSCYGRRRSTCLRAG